VLRGNLPAKIDDKGRLKVPNGFRSLIADEYGTDLFLTSLSGEYVRIYPLPVWLEIERKIAGIPSSHPSRQRFLDRVNFFGHPGELDQQGRVLIPPRLRETASMSGDVDVFGQYNYLEVWNHDRFLAKLQREPYTDEDARALAGFGL
jgi:MraZ protein